MEITKKSIVGNIVAENFKTARIFSAKGIDFCCKGNKTIEEVCLSKNIDEVKLISELQTEAKTQEAGEIDFRQWDIDLLADYIEKKHHRYVEETLPELTSYVSKIAKVHGGNHPELIEIESLFLACAGELTKHMKKEELILFPYIRKLVSGKLVEKSHFASIQNPISIMQLEHETEGLRFEKIRELSNNYLAPQDACSTYVIAFAMLNEFEKDLHKHIHLENNILFPKSIELEKGLLLN